MSDSETRLPEGALLKQDTLIEAGEVFILSEGEYSNYDPIAVCRAKRDFEIDAVMQEYLDQHPKQKEDYNFQPYEFAKWLILDKDFAEDLNFREFHVGAYNTAKPELRDYEAVEDIA